MELKKAWIFTNRETATKDKQEVYSMIIHGHRYFTTKEQALHYIATRAHIKPQYVTNFMKKRDIYLAYCYYGN